MKSPSLTQITSWKKRGLVIGTLLAAALTALWLALPGIVQTQVQSFIAERTGHRLSLDKPEIALFDLSIHLSGLKLDEPDGSPLLAFDHLLIDLSPASLVQRALVFDAIRLDSPELTLVERPDGSLNWAPFLSALKSKDSPPEPDAGLPRFDIRHLTLAGGKVDFADRRISPGYATRIEPLDLTLTDISTQPDDSGRFAVTARTAFGARFELQGALALNPVAVSGDLRIDAFDLAQLGPWLQSVLPVPPVGNANFSAEYRIANDGKKLAVRADKITAGIAGLELRPQGAQGTAIAVESVEIGPGSFDLEKQAVRIEAVRLTNPRVQLPVREGSGMAEVAVERIELGATGFSLTDHTLTLGSLDISHGKLMLPKTSRPALQFSALQLAHAQIDLAGHQAMLGPVHLAEAQIQARRDEQGSMDLLAAVRQLAPPPAVATASTQATKEEANPSMPWRYRVEKLSLTRFGASLRDETIAPAAEFALENLAFEASGLSDDLTAPLPLRFGFDLRSGGRVEGAGKLTPAAPAADLKLKLTGLDLKIAQPFLAAKTHLLIAGGKLAAEGRLTHDNKGPGYRGSFALTDLRIDETHGNAALLAWKSFGTDHLAFSAGMLDIGELRLNGLDTQLTIAKDKSTNLAKLLKTPPGDETTAPASATEPVRKEPPLQVNIDRLRFYNGEMDFADHSLVLPFGTRIHKLRGSISNLSNRPGGAPGALELEGEVDDYGMARAVGQIDLFDPTGFMDLRVLFRNVEMTRLTPYTATFAGRRIDSGKLTLDLQYKISQRQLQAENQVVIDRLSLGERIESPSAKDLPLDLAIAILKDSDGRIDLGLPISGSLDDPEFSYGQIVWKAITNVLTKIVTAPFRALGALFGGGEKPEQITFEAGAAQLTPPEREKIVRLAGVLNKRPGLALTIGGSYAESDRIAMQDAQLRRALAERMGLRIAENRDAGALSTRQPKVQAALEDLYKERHGPAELAALKEGFRRANPGQMEESTGGKLVSRLSGLLHEKRKLSEEEVARLQGVDFHTRLYELLRTGENVPEERLRTLAQARSTSIVELLKATGISTERLQALPPEKEAGESGEIPLRLTLGAIKTQAGQ